ncbi:hypothetical protein Sste5346_000096 [Sporothrix stenoceras]|uniref:Uncharacterized protein n=1 Tax=Sporothrix stenoceras TaxID=5173 RepID=A0ABR3ZXY7_9PEZI
MLWSQLTLQRSRDEAEVIQVLLDNYPPSAIIITDDALTQLEFSDTMIAVCKYVDQGGTAIVMGLFPTIAQRASIGPFFAKLGLPWESGDYRSGMHLLNYEVVEKALAGNLLTKYHQKVLVLKNMDPADSWYTEQSAFDDDDDDDDVDEDEDRAKARAEVVKAAKNRIARMSAVAFTSVGRGKVGYVGDINSYKGSNAAVIAMCGL